jgi:hypothetical protein
MKLHDSETEKIFAAKIDAQFPYGDRAHSSDLIHEAGHISLNALFCVLDEICRPPNVSEVTKEQQFELLEIWSASFDHVLKAPLAHCARQLIKGQSLPWREVVYFMEEIGAFEGQRAALSIAYFTGDCDTLEGDSALDFAYQKHIDIWDQAGV